MKLTSRFQRHATFAAAFLQLLVLSAHAASYTWLRTSGGPYDWTQPSNWDLNSGFPAAAGDTASVTSDLAADITIRLRQQISVGSLNFGDTTASGNDFGFTIGNASGETFALTFDSGSLNLPARLNLQNTGTPTSTIAAPVVLNTPLVVNLSGVNSTHAQRLTFTDTVNTNDQPITVTGGVSSGGAMTISGALLGGVAALVTNNSLAPLVLTAANPNFGGRLIVNRSSLTLNTGSIANASELIINGSVRLGTGQAGGRVQSGDSIATANNPGQRLPQNRITFNGGSLTANGQPATTGNANPWQMGQEAVQDSVATVGFKSGLSFVNMAAGGNTAGTILNIATVERSPGASLYLRGTALGQSNGTKFLVGNANAYMRGAGGPSGSTTMSIIPWLAASNDGATGSLPFGFATYTPNGARALSIFEYTFLLGLSLHEASDTANVNANLFGPLNAPKTLNSLRIEGNNTSNIGMGRVLTLSSGGLFFFNSGTNGASIGAPGNAAAGTLNFGSTEGVIWANDIVTNGIGASITGTAGLTKAGTGTLVLTGVGNLYSGLTYVGAGTLQVGNGTIASTLGLSNEVAVAAGATLWLTAGNMVLDTASLRLEQYGLLNGKVTLSAGVNDTIGALYLGDTLMPAGTYGALGSNAMFQDDTWFTGAGVLTVIPEPSSAVLLLGGVALTSGCRRRK